MIPCDSYSNAQLCMWHVPLVFTALQSQNTVSDYFSRYCILDLQSSIVFYSNLNKSEWREGISRLYHVIKYVTVNSWGLYSQLRDAGPSSKTVGQHQPNIEKWPTWLVITQLLLFAIAWHESSRHLQCFLLLKTFISRVIIIPEFIKRH